MKNLTAFVAGALLLTTLAVGCQHYGGVAVSAKDKAVVVRNDGFLFGFLRKAYVCDVTDSGLANCKTTDSP